MPIEIPSVKIIECPRDAMQGIEGFIDTDAKAAYINLLLEVGFDTIDFGSFVSPKAIPQMKDTAEVLKKLNLGSRGSKLLCIVANERGARDAAFFDEISYLGYPFSISETFQQRNTRSTIGESEKTVESMLDICDKQGKGLVIYLSMAFGNPYGEDWNKEHTATWVAKMESMGVKIISLSDTVGVARPADIKSLFVSLTNAFPQIEFGAHLHCKPDNWFDKTEAAFNGGCRRFDAAIKGYGGCPMANDALVGNLATENLIQYLEEKGVETGLDNYRFNIAMRGAEAVFA